jgi:hypothetical protein
MSNNKDLPAHIELLTVGELDNPMLSSAVLQIDSKKGAFVPPRLTQQEVDSLMPIESMIVYNLDQQTLQVRQGNAWVSFSDRGVTLVNTGIGLTGGPITSGGVISLEDTGVVAGSYSNPSLTVDLTGRIMNIQNGVRPQSLCFLEAIMSQDQIIVGGGQKFGLLTPLNFDRALTNKNFPGNPFRDSNQIVLPYKGLYQFSTIINFKSPDGAGNGGCVQVSYNLLDTKGSSIVRTFSPQTTLILGPDEGVYPNFSSSILIYNDQPNQSIQACIQHSLIDGMEILHDPSLTIAQLYALSVEK